MASLDINNRKSSYNNIIKDSEKKEDSTKDNQVSSPNDCIKYQQGPSFILQNNANNSKLFDFNDTQSVKPKEYCSQLMKRVISSDEPYSMNKDSTIGGNSIDFYSPISYLIGGKKVRNRFNLKSISGSKNKYNSTSIEMSPISSKEIANCAKENTSLLIEPEKNQHNNMKPTKEMSQDTSDNRRVNEVKKKLESQSFNTDFSILSNNSSSAIDIINERIRPAKKRRNSSRDKVLNYSQTKDHPSQTKNEEETANINYHHQLLKNSIQFAQMRPLNFHFRLRPNKPECFQCFGSNVARQLIFQKNKLFPSPGPGSYFKSHSEKGHRQLIRIMKPLPKSESHLNQDSNITKLGPGSYEVKSTLLKRCCSNINNFGSCERRFIHSIDSDNPGLGAYNHSNGNTITNNGLSLKRNKSSYTSHKYNIIQKQLKEATENFVKYIKNSEQPSPGTGDYYPEQFTSIEYKIKSKQPNGAPFSSMEKRFKVISKGNTGQQDYSTFQSDFDRIQKLHQYNNRPFLLSLSQEKNKNKNSNNKVNKSCLLLSDQLKKDSYFDWNKKSFNIKYL